MGTVGRLEISSVLTWVGAPALGISSNEIALNMLLGIVQETPNKLRTKC